MLGLEDIYEDPFPRIDHIRDALFDEWSQGNIVEGTVELIGASFTVDKPTIFGALNDDYIERELEWYLSQSLYVHDIPGETPKIWKQVASPDGRINSNYGYLLFSTTNGRQYDNVLKQLLDQPQGRRAVAVYTRPWIHAAWNINGRSDFICTNAVNYYQRVGKLHAVVQMRSNDAVFGFRNDYAWQKYVLDQLVGDLNTALGPDDEGMPYVEAGDIIWQPGSLHVYERHFHLLEHYGVTGKADGPVSAKAMTGVVLPNPDKVDA